MLSSKSACMFLLFLRRIKNQIRAMMAARPTTPPTTPPAIAPVSVDISDDSRIILLVGRHPLELPPPLLAPSVMRAPTPDDVTIDPSELVIVVTLLCISTAISSQI